MTPADLVQAAQANSMPAIGLTDHNLLTGAIEFFTACKQNGIQPIIGLEIDLEHSSPSSSGYQPRRLVQSLPAEQCACPSR